MVVRVAAAAEDDEVLQPLLAVVVLLGRPGDRHRQEGVYKRLDSSHDPRMPTASASKSSTCPQLPQQTFTPLSSVRFGSPASNIVPS